MSYKIGVDVGGTFTDVCMFNQETGEVNVYKLPSTPWDPSEAIGNGIKEILELYQVSPESVSNLVHGTTVATNATLERKGAKTAIITTRGFRDLIELARQTRASLYDVQVEKPIPIIYRKMRKEVDERIQSDGSIFKALDPAEVEVLVDELKAEGVEAYAVCLLHSYINPVHEKTIKEIILKRHPGAYVSISSEVLPEIREYERMTTTALNSYIGPKVGVYAKQFKARVKEMGMNLTPYINQSNGGLMSIETTFDNPIRTALSGPAAGVSGANYITQLAGVKDIITFDMGGTSTDVSLIENYSPRLTTSKAIAEFPVKVPMTDVTAVGAGGGSIAWIDNGGMMKVGPESAGAYPGPIAYGRGGQEPTVTDANVVLHRLNPKTILGGRMKIDEEAAYKAIEEKLAKPLGMTTLEAARGIITVVNSNMARAIRVVSVERGYDPREFVLVAFGGAGALHAVNVGKDLGIHKVMIPCNPGILCAVGLLVSDIRSDYVKTSISNFVEENIDKMNGNFKELVDQGDAWLDGEKIDADHKVILRHADMRYYGQNFELSIEIPYEKITKDNIKEIEDLFHQAHKREYGYCNEGALVQIVNYRATALGKVQTIELPEHEVEGPDSVAAIIEQREVYFEESAGYVPTNIYNRDLLKAGNEVAGPAIIEQMDSTIVVPPGHTARVDKYLNLMISYEAK
ncbi:MAG: hydantoinase/oxoprolinase family protein [Clostridia bacterium]|nr:hydantoinase/oxoprolinase family protein [Clostridia bacterium]